MNVHLTGFNRKKYTLLVEKACARGRNHGFSVTTGHSMKTLLEGKQPCHICRGGGVVNALASRSYNEKIERAG
jgi:hypothetical protein